MSAAGLVSPYWHRVAELRPSLRPHVRVHRHRYRRRTNFVLQNKANGRFLRLSPPARMLLGWMDGLRDVDELWRAACERLGADAPTQEEVIRLLGQLHHADAITTDSLPDLPDLERRSSTLRRTQRLQRYKSPLAIRVPLVDPDRLLERLVPLGRLLFSPIGALAWLALVGTALATAALHFAPLTENLADRLLATQNLVLLWLTFPVLKAAHELGHGLAAKVWGAEVHEMGIMLLVFTPVPYVDATETIAFESRWRRVGVALAGMGVELAIAAIAVFAWVSMAPGTGRAIVYNVILIASVSTILFNINPLLRFDGYYALADAIEIPNLATRANRFLLSHVQRWLGIPADARAQVATAPGEAGWFWFYAPAALAYRLVIVTSIAFLVADRFFFLGAALAIWVGVSAVVLPLVKGTRFLGGARVLDGRRGRAVIRTLGVGGVLAVLLLAPLPHTTTVEGVVTTSDGAALRAGADGIVIAVEADPHQRVDPGHLVLSLENPDLHAEVATLRAELREYEARHAEQLSEDVVQSRLLAEELEKARADLREAEERLASLSLRSHVAGVVLLPERDDLPGRFLARGDAVGWVVDEVLVRAVVDQSAVDLVRQRTERVELLFADDLETAHTGRLVREVPQATRELPSPVLSLEGGGSLIAEGTEDEGARSFESHFQFEVQPEVPPERLVSRVGLRTHVRFVHEPASLAWRAMRAVRQTFLRRLRI